MKNFRAFHQKISFQLKIEFLALSRQKSHSKQLRRILRHNFLQVRKKVREEEEE